MKKLMMITAMVTLAFGAFAQRGSGKELKPEERAQKSAEKMKTELGLSEEQYQKVLSLNEVRAEKMKQRREEMAARREEMKAERNAYQNELKGILTAEQYASLEAKREARREHFKRQRLEKRHEERKHKD